MKDIEILIQYGKFKEASEWFKKNKLSKEYDKNDSYWFGILKSRALIGLKQAVEALAILEEIIEATKKDEATKQFLEALFAKSVALEISIKYTQALDVANQGLKHFNAMPKTIQSNYQLQKAKLLERKAICFYQLGNTNQATLYCKKALRLFEEINNSFGIAFMLSIIGLVHIRKNNFIKSLEFLEESLALFEEMNNEYQSAIIYHYLSRVYNSKGEPNRAFEFMNKSLPIVMSFDDDYRLVVTLVYLIPILVERGEYKKAKEYSLQSLGLSEKLGYSGFIGFLYYKLIRIALYQGNIDEARKNLSILYSLREKYDNQNYYQGEHHLSEALILMSSKKISDLTIAEQNLRELIKTKSYGLEITFEAIYFLCEILLQEFQTTNDLSVLDEIDVLSKDLMKFGNMEELTGLRIRGNNIRLLLLFVQEQSEERAVNYREINRLLKRTKELANKMGLKSTTHYFTQQYTELVNQKQLWDDFINKYY